MKQHPVYHQLRQAIYKGILKPGEKLVERKLARQFATSRGPLRESLLQLTAEGLVHSTPQHTCQVDDLTQEDVYDIYLMRLLLEPAATRLVAEKAPVQLARKLEKLALRIASQMEAGRASESAEADFEFHREIVLGCGSPRLIRAYQMSHVPILASQLSPHHSKPQILRDIHLEIVQHIRDRAAAKAEAAARRHVEKAFRNNQSAAQLMLQSTNSASRIRAAGFRETIKKT